MESICRIVLADDHPLVLDGINGLLAENPLMKVVGKAEDGDELMKILETIPTDIVIADINMPKKDGIMCTRLIKRSYPQIKVLILTMYNDKSFLKALIDAGADGCLLKSHRPQELIEAIERLMNQKKYFDRVGDFEESKMSHEEGKASISDREKQIIRLILQDKTSREISEILFISEHTVNTHRKNINRKLGIANLSDLASFALNHNLL